MQGKRLKGNVLLGTQLEQDLLQLTNSQRCLRQEVDHDFEDPAEEVDVQGDLLVLDEAEKSHADLEHLSFDDVELLHLLLDHIETLNQTGRYNLFVGIHGLEYRLQHLKNEALVVVHRQQYWLEAFVLRDCDLYVAGIEQGLSDEG